MARTYKRDARGRFAGGGGGSGGGRKSAKLPAPTKRTATGKTKRQGLLTQRAAVSAAQAKLKSKDPADRSLTGQLSLRAQKAAVTRAKNKLAAAQKTGRIRLSGRDGVIRKGKAKGGERKAASAAKGPGLDAASVDRRLARAAAGPSRKKKTKAQSDRTASTRRNASLIYRGQQSLAKSGELTGDVVKRGTRKMAQQAAARAATAKDRKARRLVSRMDSETFAGRMKRAMSAPLRRSIGESDRNNALTGSQRRATDWKKREAAAQKRQANSERTANRARQFYYNFGSASTFGRRQKQSTASSPNFGSKRRGRRRK
jgi:hypothetical protein